MNTKLAKIIAYILIVVSIIVIGLNFWALYNSIIAKEYWIALLNAFVILWLGVNINKSLDIIKRIEYMKMRDK